MTASYAALSGGKGASELLMATTTCAVLIADSRFSAALHHAAAARGTCRTGTALPNLVATGSASNCAASCPSRRPVRLRSPPPRARRARADPLAPAHSVLAYDPTRALVLLADGPYAVLADLSLVMHHNGPPVPRARDRLMLTGELVLHEVRPTVALEGSLRTS